MSLRMTRASRHRVTVQEGGRIELQSDLKAGQSAEVIVLAEEAADERPNASFLGAGRGAFSGPEEVERFLGEERDQWAV